MLIWKKPDFTTINRLLQVFQNHLLGCRVSDITGAEDQFHALHPSVYFAWMDWVYSLGVMPVACLK